MDTCVCVHVFVCLCVCVCVCVWQNGTLSDVSYTWIASAGGSYSKATADLNTAFLNTDFNDAEACRIINERIMVVSRPAEPCLIRTSAMVSSLCTYPLLLHFDFYKVAEISLFT